jgi:hypothetical protein
MSSRGPVPKRDCCWRSRKRAWVAIAIGLVLVVNLGRAGGTVDAQDVPIASPIVWATSTPSPEPSSTSTPEPTPTATVTQEPAATSTPAGIDAIRIEVRSADGTVGPGGSIVYHYRVVNTASSPVRVRLVASVDRVGWTVDIVEAGGATSLAQPFSLAAGQVRDVSVAVFAPIEAVAGEQATLRLTAVNAVT